jgi:DNA-binding transcriptional regulator YhcF (GntR family)
MGLKRHAGSKKKCWPSVRHLAIDLGMSSKTVMRGIVSLEVHSIIKRNREHKYYNEYELLHPKKWKKLGCSRVVLMKKASASSLESFREINNGRMEL